MAALCHHCALETFGEDNGDLAGLSTPADTAARRYVIVLCEGCGPIQVDNIGRRIDANSNTPSNPLPRILNKHIHGIPAGANYIGRGSPWGNPFVIGRDGTRAEVIAKYDAWFDTQPQLIARLPELRGCDLVCFCFPRSCRGETLRRRANARVCQAV